MKANGEAKHMKMIRRIVAIGGILLMVLVGARGVLKDLNATDDIWDFFTTHPKHKDNP